MLNLRLYRRFDGAVVADCALVEGVLKGVSWHGLFSVKEGLIVQIASRCSLARLDDLEAWQFAIANRAIGNHLAAELDPKSKRSRFDRAGKVASDPAFGVLVVIVRKVASGNFVAHESPNGLDSLLGHSFALCVVHSSSPPEVL
jgi:hypothetical protein